MSLFSRRIKKNFNRRARDFFWPKIGWGRVYSYYRKRLFRISDSARAIAVGLATGAAVSMTPFIGLHLILTAFLCFVLRGNLLASMIGTLIGNPVTFPFIWLMSYYIGGFLLGIDTHAANLKGGLSYELLTQQFTTLFLPMILGGVLMALAVWFAIFYPLVDVIERYQELRKKRISDKKKLLMAIKEMLEKRKKRKNLFKDRSLDKLLYDTAEGRFNKLGEGLWSAVYDLDNDCVIKISKETAGIGSGAHKINNERNYLKKIEALKVITPFEIPHIVDYGDIKKYTTLRQTDYHYWTILSKVQGQKMDTDDIAKWSFDKKEMLADNLMKALSQLHGLLDKVYRAEQKNLNLETPPAEPNRMENAIAVFEETETLIMGHRFYEEIVQELIELYAYHFDFPKRLVHGDFNIANVFLNEDYQVASILDFAETGLGFVEQDVTKMICELPSLEKDFIERYQHHAGVHLNATKIQFYKTRQALYSALIKEFSLKSDKETVKKFRNRLRDQMKKFKALAHGVS